MVTASDLAFSVNVNRQFKYNSNRKTDGNAAVKKVKASTK